MEEQRYNIKFCVKNEIKCVEVVKMLQKAYRDQAMDQTIVYKWYRRFKDGREETVDDPLSGRPSTSKTGENVEEIKKIVLENRRITVREIAEEMGI